MPLPANFRAEHLEPPPWLYARLAQGSLMRLIYRLFVADLAGGLPRGTRLLDVGTGPGYLLGYLARTRPDLNLWGLDYAYDMIRRARPRQRGLAPQARPRWVVADACRLPFPDGVFGQVISTFSFHIWPCPVAGLQELRRILQPGDGPGSMNCAGKPRPGSCGLSPGRPDCLSRWSTWDFKPCAGTMPCRRENMPTSFSRPPDPGGPCALRTTFSGGPNSNRPELQGFTNSNPAALITRSRSLWGMGVELS